MGIMNRTISNSMNNVTAAEKIRNNNMRLRMNNRIRRRDAKKENKKTKYREINKGRMEGISSIRAEVKEKMESYKDYCDRLKDAYLKKHAEIEEAKNKKRCFNRSIGHWNESIINFALYIFDQIINLL